MKSGKLREQTKLWRLPNLGNVELLHATYITQNFAPHTHEGFAVGVIENGALAFDYRGQSLIAPPGTINLANPDEPHNGHAAAETGWTYRMFYLDAELLRQAASEIAGCPKNLPFFQAGVIWDDELSLVIHGLHRAMEKKEASLLEQESRLLWMLTQLIMRHGDAPPSLCPVGNEHGAVKRARDYIEAYSHENISIEQLTRVAHLSPFHFIRVFRRETGLTPHAYLTQVRVKRARELLSAGWAIAPTAYETGFVDQSHLTRHFKRILGVTPGQYSNFVQDR
jgi:AraC-like DNA-binding protein